ncbi:hypothetical protein U1Q18_047746 [Sarracenia purpurea var. burkii]
MKVVGTVVIVWMVVGAVVVVPTTEAVITCGTVLSNLSPCINYLRKGGAASQPCCNGVQRLYGQAKTKADRQAVCKCVTSIAASIPGLNYSFASSLAGKCGVKIAYKLTPNFDCSIVT